MKHRIIRLKVQHSKVVSNKPKHDSNADSPHFDWEENKNVRVNDERTTDTEDIAIAPPATQGGMIALNITRDKPAAIGMAEVL